MTFPFVSETARDFVGKFKRDGCLGFCFINSSTALEPVGIEMLLSGN